MTSETIRNMSASEFQAYTSSHREREYALLDVREPEEYEQEHIPGALNLPLSELEERLEDIPGDRELVVYCRSGRRSLAGASLINETSGLSTPAIFNLDGGITAWEGKDLPDLPRISLFSESDDFMTALGRAANMEKGAYAFYSAISSRMPQSPLAPTVENLQEMERRHARSIHEMMTRHGRVPPFDDFFAGLSGDVVEGGMRLEDLLDSDQWTGPQGCMALAEIALDIEYRAFDLYKTLASRTKDPEQEQALLFLAEQEKTHIRLLAKGLPACVEG
jgi:rhodanese-related sulfurtransferase/rubrerythrin